MIDHIYNIMCKALEDALRDHIEGVPLPKMQVDKNLVTLSLEDTKVSFDFNNGKVDKVWLNGVYQPFTIPQMYNLTLLMI